MNTFWLIYHGSVLMVLLWTLGGLLVNLVFFRSLKPSTSGTAARAKGKKVSILVPARNEEARIGECVRSLLAQDYPSLEWIILNDRSEDETEAIIRGLGFTDAGDKRIVNGALLPAGWTGKNWACHQLAEAATGDYVFFTDADTVHSPETVRAAVALMESERIDLLSAWPRLVTVGLGEKLVIPLIHLLAAAMYPHALVTIVQRVPALAQRAPRSLLRAMGAANGQFLFFRRESYDAIGGHAAVRAHLVEDVALGRAMAERIPEGYRLRNCDASGLVDCRMYTAFHEVWEGFTKNLRPAFERSTATFIFMGALQFCAFLLPFLLWPLQPEWRTWILLQIAIVLTIRLVLAVRFRTSLVSCLLHPVGHLLALAIGVNSWRRSTFGTVSWKGRDYRPELSA